MTEQRVTVTVSDGVADVRLNRPDKRNALDHAMFDGIFAAADQVANDASVRVVVLSGVGKAFCAGLDTSLLSQMAGERTTESTPSMGCSATSGSTRRVRCACGRSSRCR